MGEFAGKTRGVMGMPTGMLGATDARPPPGILIQESGDSSPEGGFLQPSPGRRQAVCGRQTAASAAALGHVGNDPSVQGCVSRSTGPCSCSGLQLASAGQTLTSVKHLDGPEATVLPSRGSEFQMVEGFVCL